MATRNQRRRQARHRAREADTARGVGKASHGDRMMARLVKAAGTRQPQTNPNGQWDPDKTLAPPLPPDALWTIFEQNAWHAACINAKVADSVGRGWKLVPEDDTEDGADDDVDKVTRQLTDTLRAVCSELTFPQLCQQAVRELDAIGWGGWEVLRDTPGDVTTEIVGLLPVPAMGIRAVKGTREVFCVARGDKKVYFKRFGVDKQVDYITGEPGDQVEEGREANELILFKHYTPRSPFYGIPPWVSGLPAVAEFAAIREFNVSFFESGGQADRHIHVTAADDEVAGELADSITKQLEDARGVAHVSIVSHGSEDTKVSVNTLTPKQPVNGRETEFRGGKQDLREEILGAHQVPPGRVGIAISGALGGNVADSQDDDYRYGVVDPLQEIVEAELARTLFGPNGFELPGYTFEFEDMTQDDEAENHDQAMEAVDKGVMSPNDAREKIGEDRVEDPALDRHYIGGQPVSTDPAVSEVKQLLSELKDALTAATREPHTSRPDEELDVDDPTVGADVDTVEPDAVVASAGFRRAGWAIFRRGSR